MTLTYRRIGQQTAAFAPSYRYGVVLPENGGPMTKKALAAWWVLDKQVSKPQSAPSDDAIRAAIERVNQEVQNGKA